VVPGRLAIGTAVGVHVRVHRDRPPRQWQHHHHHDHLLPGDAGWADGAKVKTLEFDHGDIMGISWGYNERNGILMEHHWDMRRG